MRRSVTSFFTGLALLSLAACREEAKDEPLPPRPVLTTTAARSSTDEQGFSGTIAPRYETNLAFRTLGRIVSRAVDVGEEVKKDQEVAAIDAETLSATVRQAKAQVASARAQADNAAASAERARRLFEEKTVSSAELESANQSKSTADAALERAEAELAKAENALTYAVLTAPYDGVVTQVSLDVGEVAAAGQPVMTIARTDVREAVVDIPTDELDGIKVADRFRVRLQTDPTMATEGSVREIAPEADAATRSNRVRILLDQPPPGFRLGALIRAFPVRSSDDLIRVPQTAVLEEGGEAYVWVVPPKASTVEKRKVSLGERRGDVVEVVSGLNEGETVVIAGVHSLEENQAVTLSGEPS
ncbi:efflux RND transporter periplasmic adaptor subunit [Consotaella salsifontis]|uniref:RND family efflux transporter, MFP subunit n=1 Tax=Consotaella salsifontis TaxID=1365950 RepID=A0A1T4MTM7_9HYPH|nr:efflux RND transporter periplasmic adaptor subunit [Consotaella salsifontis]SJZ70177.1 RND family efflux transporter, MFP subunit [Consotaella salsifontis]